MPSSGLSWCERKTGVDMSSASKVAQGLFGLVAALCFFLGITNNANQLVRTDGYNEVFTVLGSLFVFPIVYSLHETIRKFIPFSPLPRASEIHLWAIGLRVVLALGFVIQQSILMVYLVLYVSPLCYGFLVADVALLFAMLKPKHLGTVWSTSYVLVHAGKISIFWPNLDQKNSQEQNTFDIKNNEFGPNGLLAVLFLTIAMIQFPVLISRVLSGSNIYEAYTTNMAAVFAHTLHILDTLSLYYLGLNRTSFPDDVQYMILMFSVMGNISCNLYYIYLFFKDDSVERTLKRFQPHQIDFLEASETSTETDESLLHYFVWMLFFIDLPYVLMRGIAWVVHGTRLSVFFAKNLMMMSAVAMLMIKHYRTAN